MQKKNLLPSYLRYKNEKRHKQAENIFILALKAFVDKDNSC